MGCLSAMCQLLKWHKDGRFSLVVCYYKNNKRKVAAKSLLDQRSSLTLSKKKKIDSYESILVSSPCHVVYSVQCATWGSFT